MEQLYDISELELKALRGTPLMEGEASALRADLSLRLMKKQSFDFGELDGHMNFGLEASALKERNERWAKNGPKCPTPKPFPYDRSPASIILCGPLYDGKRGVERMLDSFRFKLEQVKETGVL